MIRLKRKKATVYKKWALQDKISFCNCVMQLRPCFRLQDMKHSYKNNTYNGHFKTHMDQLRHECFSPFIFYSFQKSKTVSSRKRKDFLRWYTGTKLWYDAYAKLYWKELVTVYSLHLQQPIKRNTAALYSQKLFVEQIRNLYCSNSVLVLQVKETYTHTRDRILFLVVARWEQK